MKNPFIEHLGPLLSKDSFYSEVTQLKHNSIWYPEDDEQSKIEAALDRLYIPYHNHYQAYKIVHNLLKRYFYSYDMEKVINEKKNYIQDKKINSSEPAFMIIGSTGIGKTMLINLIIKLLGKIKLFPELNNLLHIPILKVETPGKRSLNQLMLNILEKIDYIADTDLYETFQKWPVEELRRQVKTAVRTHKIGMIIFDEIHNLINTNVRRGQDPIPKETEQIIKYLKTFSNETNIPMVLIGTFEAEKLLSEPQTSRRITGEGKLNLVEPHLYSNTPKEEQAWKSMMNKIWEVQIADHFYPLTDEIEELYYKKTLGIPDLIFKLHKNCLLKLLEINGTDNEIEPALIEAVSQDMPNYNEIVKSFPLESTARKYLQYITSIATQRRKTKRKGATSNKQNSAVEASTNSILNENIINENSIIEMTSNSNNSKQNIDVLIKKGVISDLDSIISLYCD
ncbi:MAG: hypothetical protein DSY77_04365 [Bacteroidetes bacterium]|nr:MAG: hypothetical protein DSY77_04365 [Bacteroidota bacterium]